MTYPNKRYNLEQAKLMVNKMKIAIGSDHSGYELKQNLILHLRSHDHDVDDVGTYNNDEPSDYPDYANKVCENIIQERSEVGILICGTGIGMSICANRKSGIRAALCQNELMAKKARNHNDANILVLGAKLLNSEEAIKILESFLASAFDGGRHTVRLNKFN